MTTPAIQSTSRFGGTSRPDWVMLGVTVPDGVMIVASTALTEAEMRADVDLGDVIDDLSAIRVRRPSAHRYTVTAVMPRCTVVFADDYPEAFQRLFASWSASEQRGITP